MEIANRRVGTVHFTLRDEQGAEITSTRGHQPLVYLHGTGSIAAGLEQALEGRAAGDRFTVTVPPEQGFGPRHEALVQSVARDVLDARSEPVVGQKLQAQTARGPLDVVVTAVEADAIHVDGNHPLAGRPFVADVEVVDVRLATPEELQFGLG
ncbi:peptidylprolyl isomerase [Luteimonas yindakuii]|uniref:Peptidyl-prolyl cis-trans isomerase n=1 Tax=Luteimonas yindakuii TaxID=2565782 RepID=A0A4Z1R9P5_9GAMM|nr:peptidylprolyl isomerase [Luteimonas yindakuii]QCO67229.1 peptidylprolyl isomerase [Luteimonas yindakuii]TKS53418.1 peptidylprolyl isomerase [Luteimonas yindakuii]